jgi:putative peptidoglycan lipid II flippase
MSTIGKSIRRHLNDKDSLHRRIALGFLWVGLFVLMGKLAGAAKEMTIAWRYGLSETVDAYVFVFNLISLPVSIWFSVLTVILLPLLAKLHHDSPADLPLFRRELLGLTTAVGALLGLVAYIGLPTLLNSSWIGLSAVALQESQSLVGVLCLLLPLGMVISLFSASLMASGHHSNTLLEAVPALCIIAALLIPYGCIPEPLVWGTVAGFALQLAGLCWPLQRAREFHRPALTYQSPAWKGFWGSFGIMAAGHSLMSVTGIIDQFFAAHLGVGAISTLSYANRIISLIMSLGAITISRSILPVFSELMVQGKDIEIRELTRHWMRLMFALGIVVLAVSWALAPFAVKLVFERGAFTASNTKAVTIILQYGLMQIPFYFSALVLISMLASQNEYRKLAVIGFLNMLVKIILGIIFVRFYDLKGIMISTALMYSLSLLFLIYVVRKNLTKLKNEY